MDKNTIIGFVLMALVLIGFSYFSTPSAEQIQQQQQADSIAAVERMRQAEQAEAVQRAVEEQHAALLQDSTSLLFAARTGTEQKVELKNKLAKVTLSTKGGIIEQVELMKYQDRSRENTLLLFTPETSQMRFLLATKTENIRTDELFFRPINVTDSSVTMRLDVQGGSLDFIYTLQPDAYMVNLTIQANGIGDLFLPQQSMLGIEWTDAVKPQEKGYSFENRYATLTYHEASGSTDNLSETKKDDKKIEDALDWIAFKNQFFSAIIIAPFGEFTEGELHSYPYLTADNLPKEEREAFLKTYVAKLQTPFDPTGVQPTQLQFYLGPNDHHLLKTHNKLCLNADKDLELEDLVYLGWPIIRWINRWFIIYLFDWLSAMGLHMGLVLLLLTLIVKVLVYPTTRKSFLSSARMRVLKPKVDALNAKYPKKEDAMKKQQEMMQLYSQYGVSPMGGCLPMLIQMPIWIALFNFVPNAIELRGQSFLWADDLSAYDDVIHWGTDLWLIGDHLSIFCLLFCAVQIGNTLISMKQQQNAAMSPEQEQSMKMMRWMMYLMPVMFFFMFNTYSSGLNYYYFLSGITSIIIMWVLRKTTDDEKLLAQLEAYKAKRASNPKKMSGLAARLEAMQKQAEELQKQQRK
ncbi:MAG: membrane protein insertase YidC [Bacteroidaceae bacterium]|nr:membrane protein insertase YidC [Bacteroidaceae bacterium]